MKDKLKPWTVAFWLLVWQLLAMAVGQEILLASPARVLARLGALAVTADFWRSILHSMLRIGGGFLLGTFAGTALALMSARFEWVRSLLSPLMRAVKSVPVASFIILALVWVSSKHLAVLIVFLMVLPVIYANVLSGLERLDPKLEEVARVFRLPRLKRALRVELPQLMPDFLTGCRLALGLCWKAGTAAEVIGMPRGSIGERLQQAKVYLDTPDLFAWTVVILILSLIFERAALWVFRRLGACFSRLSLPGERPRPNGAAAVSVDGLCKRYGDKDVLRGFSMNLPAGGTTCLMAPSGAGKTTLLRLMCDLEKPDSGIVRGMEGTRIGVVFQEDRLLDWLDPVENLRLTAPGLTRDAAADALARFGLGDSLHEPVCRLSGGMRRRVALLRALLAPSDILLLDEPFNGLDAATRSGVMALTRELLPPRTALLITHDPDEAAALGAAIVGLN